MMLLKEASIHGRFQPPHLQHLEYFLEAKKRCSFLWIGVTRYMPRKAAASPHAPHREPLSSNPLTYFERVEAITAALEYAQVRRNEFGFIPFPIEEPSDIKNFLNTSITCFTTLVDQWNSQKIQTLESLGYKVEVLIDRTQHPKSEIITASYIREKALAGDPIWKTLIAPGALPVLEKIDLPKRLAELKKLEDPGLSP